MVRFITLLRGVNVGGKNQLSMPALKKSLVAFGFQEVVTYLNSGNIIFTSELADCHQLSQKIQGLIVAEFQLKLQVFTLPQATLQQILRQAPAWWGTADKSIYDNLIFMIPPLTDEEFDQEMGELAVELEQAQKIQQTVFWSYRRQDYQKSRWWKKTASTKIKDQLTIRTANTVKKIAIL